MQNYLALAAWAERKQLVKQKGAADPSTASELVAELLGLVQELEQAFGA